VLSSYVARTKDEIAGVITHHFPELAPWRPSLRKSWMSADEGMSIFDAAVFALTFFQCENNRECVVLA